MGALLTGSRARLSRWVAVALLLGLPGIAGARLPSVRNRPLVEEQGGLLPPGAGGASFDQAGRPLATYTKYDENGNNQIYAARRDYGQWRSYRLTSFRHRWVVEGQGTLARDLVFTRLVPVGRNRLVLFFRHRFAAPFWQATAFRTEDFSEAATRRRALPSYLETPTTPGLQVNLSSYYVPLREGAKAYLLRWETLPVNRDEPPPDGEAPPPQALRLVEVTAGGGWPPGVVP